ncbi:hypothetical protein CCACVL1_11021 [Corchorus capsularis]|uniref:Uncharacterized protein n=1 Tax=Corchorus capsularis TaxID=210143 RepID=A0A1R3INA7_COCAP|nr:hypothetical protein CCACVL1_11021 [Corchorus capsularis]
MLDRHLNEMAYRTGNPIFHDAENVLYDQYIRAFYSRRTTRVFYRDRRDQQQNRNRNNNTPPPQSPRQSRLLGYNGPPDEDDRDDMEARFEIQDEQEENINNGVDIPNGNVAVPIVADPIQAIIPSTTEAPASQELSNTVQLPSGNGGTTQEINLPQQLNNPQEVPIPPPNIDLPTLNRNFDPAEAFNESANRVRRIQNYFNTGGPHTLAEIHEMRAALAEEKDRFEEICRQVVRHGHAMMQDIQNRGHNDPLIQPTSNDPRWINFPGGGILFTNARITTGRQRDQAESSAMGASRGQEREQSSLSRQEFLFQLEMEFDKSINAHGISESLQVFNIRANNSNLDGTFGPAGDIRGNQTVLTPRTTEPVEENYNLNEIDVVTAFLRDSPSPTQPQAEVEERDNLKRKRDEDENENLETEMSRTIRQRLEYLAVTGDVNGEVSTSQATEGLRQAVPDQPPKQI